MIYNYQMKKCENGKLKFDPKAAFKQVKEEVTKQKLAVIAIKDAKKATDERLAMEKKSQDSKRC
uniref:Uncharacterized protein n=1 Tax=Meloidogyne enterolobii TaxID=390850 RepID=A0A6V7WAD9_MELEN|nr:unnamed protein product [Meloidogyne enterolobii]